jgi:glyceraldehyde-3-phosphate dehydrogenase (NADP+)
MDKTIVAPTVLYPVTPAMRVYDEEQFGPLVPIVRFRETTEIVQSVLQSSFGQQASVFSQQPATVGPLLDVLVNQVSRVNLNAQCQRGPDSFPFTGRKNSACGTLSIADALRVFSIRSVVAFKETKASQDLVAGVMNGKLSAFLRSDYLF